MRLFTFYVEFGFSFRQLPKRLASKWVKDTSGRLLIDSLREVNEAKRRHQGERLAAEGDHFELAVFFGSIAVGRLQRFETFI